MKKLTLRQALLTICCLFVIAVTNTGCGGGDSGGGGGLTLSTFNEIQHGMSYQQVAAIIGRDADRRQEMFFGTVYQWQELKGYVIQVVIGGSGVTDKSGQVLDEATGQTVVLSG